MGNTLRIDPLTKADFATVAALAGIIWREHYAALLGMAQVEYMLAGRTTAQNLGRYLDADDRGFVVLRVADIAVGYCSYARTADPHELKLEQLYLLAQYRGQGAGGAMLRHVEDHARTAGCRILVLTVNKKNASAIAMYRKAGFAVREEAEFDIGNGYVMDDYVMAKPL